MNYNPFISIIIPALNAANTLEICLQSIITQNYLNFEVLVVDNNSTDDTAKIAVQNGVRVINYSDKYSANICRNLGAAHALGEVLLFLDSDVVLPKGTLQWCVEYFSNSEVSAVIGVYSAKHRNPNICSQYKNFWIRYSYLYRGNKIGGIFGAVSAIRKKVFTEAGEFDEKLRVKEIDDLDLGIRIRNIGHKIHFKEDLEVEHLKAYTLQSLLKNQFNRTLGFFSLAAKSKLLSGSLTLGIFNVYPAFIYSTVLAPTLFFSLPLIYFFQLPVMIWLTIMCLYFALNFPFYKSYLKHYTILETIAIMVLMFLDHFVCALGLVTGAVNLFTKKLIPSAKTGK